MQNEEQILSELKSLHAKIDSLAAQVTLLLGVKKRKAEARKGKAKLLPLTQDEINMLEAKFKEMYARWLNNQETAVHEELEAMSPDDLRRFADANNLNVTTKTSKERVIQLIGFRFREKKQLTQAIGKP